MTRLLLVEDDAAQARSLARSLARRRPDLTVLTSSNGVEAIELLSAQSVDLILTDLAMPELDGFALLAWTANHCPEVPTFAMSAFGAEDTMSRVNALGAVGYFTKPIDVGAVVSRLSDELSHTVRGHVQNVSLASFLQLLEMERKTCTLTVTCGSQSGVLVIRKGELIDAESGALHGEQAAVAIVAWPNPTISISSQLACGTRVIEKPLGFMIMEAMRMQDEQTRDALPSEWPAPRRTVRPSRMVKGSVPAAEGSRSTTHGVHCLPGGVRAIAVVETAAGTVLHSYAADDFPIVEIASMAALVLRQQVTTISVCNAPEWIEELVFSSSTGCEVLRPLGADAAQFVLLSFAPEETNLVMARLELDRFIFTQGLLLPRRGSQDAPRQAP